MAGEVREPSARYIPYGGGGYVIMWKKSLTSAVFQDPITWKIFCWCIFRANYEPIPVDMDGDEVYLKRGEFLTGSFSMVNELKLPKSTIWRHLKKLVRFKCISIKSGQHFSIVGVCNYGHYQDPAFKPATPLKHHRDTNETPSGTDNTYKESKELKSLKGKSKDSLGYYRTEKQRSLEEAVIEHLPKRLQPEAAAK